MVKNVETFFWRWRTKYYHVSLSRRIQALSITGCEIRKHLQRRTPSSVTNRNESPDSPLLSHFGFIFHIALLFTNNQADASCANLIRNLLKVNITRSDSFWVHSIDCYRTSNNIKLSVREIQSDSDSSNHFHLKPRSLKDSNQNTEMVQEFRPVLIPWFSYSKERKNKGS